MITEEEVDKALEYLRTSAPKAAAARSQAKMLEKFVAITEAQHKQAHKGEGSNADATDAARASADYKQAVEAWGAALEEDAKHQMLREAAIARLDIWRTMEATKRAEERAMR